MRTIITTTTPPPSESIPSSIFGIKADTLTQLQELGLQIPEWMVIPSTIFSEYVPESILDHCDTDIIPFIRNISLEPSLIDSIHKWVRNNGLDNAHFAVRSSICIDRSLGHTFAGQLKTNLCVRSMSCLMLSLMSGLLRFILKQLLIVHNGGSPRILFV
jgi:phosphoenolpyruvate synthase/pyruvate phosphate dikinase